MNLESGSVCKNFRGDGKLAKTSNPPTRKIANTLMILFNSTRTVKVEEEHEDCC